MTKLAYLEKLVVLSLLQELLMRVRRWSITDRQQLNITKHDIIKMSELEAILYDKVKEQSDRLTNLSQKEKAYQEAIRRRLL